MLAVVRVVSCPTVLYVFYCCHYDWGSGHLTDMIAMSVCLLGALMYIECMHERAINVDNNSFC